MMGKGRQETRANVVGQLLIDSVCRRMVGEMRKGSKFARVQDSLK